MPARARVVEPNGTVVAAAVRPGVRLGCACSGGGRHPGAGRAGRGLERDAQRQGAGPGPVSGWRVGTGVPAAARRRPGDHQPSSARPRHRAGDRGAGGRRWSPCWRCREPGQARRTRQLRQPQVHRRPATRRHRGRRAPAAGGWLVSRRPAGPAAGYDRAGRQAAGRARPGGRRPWPGGPQLIPLIREVGPVRGRLSSPDPQSPGGPADRVLAGQAGHRVVQPASHRAHHQVRRRTGRAPAAGLGRCRPAAGLAGRRPAAGLGRCRPAAGLAGRRPAAGLGRCRPAAGLAGRRSAAGLAGRRSAAGLGRYQPAARLDCGWSAVWPGRSAAGLGWRSGGRLERARSARGLARSRPAAVLGRCRSRLGPSAARLVIGASVRLACGAPGGPASGTASGPVGRPVGRPVAGLAVRFRRRA